MLFQARCSYINEHLLKIWNISNFFFQNKKLFENFPPTIFSLFKIVLFLIKKIYFHEPEHSRDFRWKILIKWRCPDRYFVDIIFHENDTKKTFFYYWPQNYCDHFPLSSFCIKIKKKTKFGKSRFLSQSAFLKELPSNETFFLIRSKIYLFITIS